MAEVTLQHVVAAIKAEGHLTRTSSTNSIRALRLQNDELISTIGNLTSTLSSFLENLVENQREAAIQGQERDLTAATSSPKNDDRPAVPVATKEEKKGLLDSLSGGLAMAIGPLLAGVGIIGIGLAAGALALKGLANFDAGKIKENVIELLSIREAMGKGKLDFFLEGGTFFLTMSGIGLGLAAFGLGSAAAGIGEWVAGDNWSQTVVDNVETLMKIPGMVSGVDTVELAATLGGIGLGLALFGVGQTAVGAGNAVTGASELIKKFEGGNWAQSVVDNVQTLMKIPNEMGILEAAGAVVKFPLVMGALGLGLALFGVGKAVEGVGEAVQGGAEYVQKFTEGGNFGERVKNEVFHLLDILNHPNAGWTGGMKFAAVLGGIGFGLAAFAVGKGAEGVAEGAQEAIATFTDGGGFAERIKNEVETLLSIMSLPGIGADTAGFVLVMGGIGAGLAAFAFGKGAEGVASAVQKFSSNEPYGEKIKNEVTQLLSILQDPNITPDKASEFQLVLQRVGEGLSSFSGGKFIDALAGAGAAILNFLSGNESPIEQVRTIANEADRLNSGADALERIAGALKSLSDLRFDGADFNIREFAEDLMESIPAIETAIRGGTVGEGFFSSGTEIAGLASSSINYELASQRIRELRQALHMEMNAPAAQVVAASAQGAAQALGAQTIVDASTVAPTTVNNTNVSRGRPTPTSSQLQARRAAASYGY